LTQTRLSDARAAVAAEGRALARVSPRSLIDRQRQHVDDLWQRACTSVEHRVQLQGERLRGLGTHLQALSPLAVLERGFAIVWRAGGGVVVSHVAQAQPGDRLQIQVSDGRFGAIVDGQPKRNRAARQDESTAQLSLGLPE
jgi:exodeoxyribonuclease VII large subunit